MELLLNDIDAGNCLSHRMFNLKASVHLHEINRITWYVKNKLNGTGTQIVNSIGNFFGTFKNKVPQRRGQQGGSGLLEQLLIIALDTTISQTDHSGITMTIAQNLSLDVAQRRHAFFDIDVPVTKSTFGFGRHLVEQLMQMLWTIDFNNTFTATPVHGLQ